MKLIANLREHTNNYSLLLLFVFYILLDAFAKIFAKIKYETEWPLYVKIGLLLFIALLYLLKKPNKKELVTLGALLLCFVIGQMFLSNSFTENSLIIGSKFLASLMLLFFFNTISLSTTSRKWLFSSFEWIIICNSIFIWIGFFFELDIFEAYRFKRFGYNGLLGTPSIATYTYAVSLLYFVLNNKRNVFRNWKFYLVLCTCFLLGTKAIFIAIFFGSLFLILNKSSKFQKPLFIVLPLLFVAGLLYFLYTNPTFNAILEKDSFISALFSYRDKLLVEKTIPFISEHWSVMNYIFGGVSNYNLRSQMELIDIFFFWGIIGGLIYLIQFIRAYWSFKYNKDALLIVVTLTPIIILSGNFFVYVLNTLFLIILREKYRDFQCK